jgi:LysR family glycine cleavage system transcriptional activator/LysR family transcriptional regulator of beta-lactamase
MLPLTALRAFDLVARHGSFTEAARSLNVTRPAVSKQIRHLENVLNRQLLLRGHPRATLTDAGYDLAKGLAHGFDAIAAAYQRAEKLHESSGSVRILVEKDFASSWLAERIGGFLVENPGVAIEVVAERNGQLRMSEDFGIRIFYGQAGDFVSNDLVAETLCDWIDLPLCTPDYAAKHVTPVALRKTARILIDQNYNPWDDWLSQSGVEGPGGEVMTSLFNDTSMCISAALAGSGITIGDSFMSLAAIRDGKLIAPFKVGLRSALCYAFCRPAFRQSTDVENRFCMWIKQEIETYQRSVDSLLAANDIRVVSVNTSV